MKTRTQKVSLSALILGLALGFVTISGYAQGGGARSIANGQKVKIKGIIVKRDNDQTFTVRDENNADVTVVLDANTSIKTKGGVLGRGSRTLGTSSLIRGLNLEVEGRGDDQGRLLASKIRFSDAEYRVARSIESRVDPVEGRVQGAEGRIAQVEDNARRTSGQLDELVAVSNAARGGARAAQETADAAVKGVSATNERIANIDDYVPQDSIAVTFRTGSAVLSPEAKAQLDGIAAKALAARGYVIEVTGYTDSAGNVDRNRALSQRRAEAVIRYLLENHQIPLRRIVPSYGYGETNSVADNTTREGRAQNRRVEVKILISKGLTQSAPEVKPPTEP